MCACTRVCVRVWTGSRPGNRWNKGRSLRHGQQLGAPASSPTSRPGSRGGRHAAVQPPQVRAEEMAGGRPGVASPPLPKGSLASTLRAPDHSRAEPGSTHPTSPRGPGLGQAAGPLRGPRCPGRWAFGKQTLHRSPTAPAQPSPPSRPRRGHLSEDTAPASPTPRRSNSRHSRPGWSHLSAPPHTSSTPKVLPQGWLRAGHSYHSPSFLDTPSPVLVAPGLGFPACKLDNTTQTQRALVPEDREEEARAGRSWAGAAPVLPCCPTGWASALGGQRGNRTRELDQQHPLRTQSRFLQLPPRLGQHSPA